MIRILVVDDSAVVRTLLVHIFESDPELVVLEAVPDGEAAVEAAARLRPDVITMDIHMPRMSGFDATRRIMETQPAPIVIVSGSSVADEVANTFQALEAGALAVAARPPGPGHPAHEHLARQLVKTVKLMSEIKVVRRWPRTRTPDLDATPTPKQPTLKAASIQLVVIGASTGGPVVLQTILSRLPHSYPIPIVIVQHLATGFIDGFVEWLGKSCDLPVEVATHGAIMQPGHVYMAPDAHHIGVARGNQIRLTPCAPCNGLCPSVSHLFQSAAEVYGRRAAGVLLTGMGKDGAAELALLREHGATTIAQDKESSVVHGMPGEAIRLGAATYVLSPEQIAGALTSLNK